MRYTVRPLVLDDADFVASYFNDADDAFLRTLGVAAEKVPSHEEFWQSMVRDLEAPKNTKERFYLVWELDGIGIGFSSIDEITVGKQANMYLHVAVSKERMKGHGAAFIRRSVPIYFKEFDLEVLYCEPNAFNTAPNRALQKAGFEYVETVEKTPGQWSSRQPLTRWRVTKEMVG